jgi:predicted dehydrogenase
MYRPYHPHYTHTVFRGWYEFGGGTMADMGIYSLWPVLTTLGLDAPLSAEAWATHTCSIVDHISGPAKNDFSYPAACTFRFQFAAQRDLPAVELFWYDGGMKPRLPAEIEAHHVSMPKEGILFLGDQGAIMAGFNGQKPQRFAQGKSEPLWQEDAASQDAKRVERELDARHKPWVQACKGGEPSPGSFLNAGSISDTVNLGTVALRAGTKVQFDSQNMKITNAAAANQYLVRQYRKGWEL